MYVCIYVCMCIYDSVIPIYTETQFSKQLSYDEGQIKLLHMGLGSNLSPGVATDFQKAVSNHSTSKVNSNSIIYQKSGLFFVESYSLLFCGEDLAWQYLSCSHGCFKIQEPRSSGDLVRHSCYQQSAFCLSAATPRYA